MVAPNTDTLYAIAPLDLRGEPYVLTVPAIHDRYYSFQMISAYTDSFAYVGTRETSGRAGRFAINPPTDPQERQTLARFAAIGVGAGRHPTIQVRDARVQAALTAGVRAGAAEVAAAASKSTHTVDGWGVNLDVGTYGHDALTRAVVAQGGWGANVPQEAVYAHSERDAAGTPYSGAHRYDLHFPSGGLPPVDAFWSVTLYGPDRFFTANPINRYAIGDRSAGLQFGSDGSLDIYIQHDAPVGHEANWLPAPTGPFVLTLRLYLPKAEVLDGHDEYPKVQAAPQ